MILRVYLTSKRKEILIFFFNYFSFVRFVNFERLMETEARFLNYIHIQTWFNYVYNPYCV